MVTTSRRTTSFFLSMAAFGTFISVAHSQVTTLPAYGSTPASAPAPTPATSYSAPASQAPQQMPSSIGTSPFNSSSPPQFPPQQFPNPNMPDFSGGNPSARPALPFDPNQFRGFNPGQMPGAQQPQPQQPREEKFVPSEIVSGLPPARGSSDLRAVLRTSMGDITLKLDRLNAPQTVMHFVALARGDKEFIDVKTSKRVKRPFYNGLTFHRVSKGYLIQTGCPFGNGRGGPGDIAMSRDEIRPNMFFNRPGLVAMAPMRDGNGTTIRSNTNGSQFFISLAPNPEWDGKYTIFAEVEDGLDVVQKIASVKVGPTERPIKRVFLAAIDIFEGNEQQQQQIPASDPSEAVPPQPAQ